MGLDINSTYTLLQALEESYPPQTLFRDTFFPNENTFNTPTVLIDYRKGSRELAPFIVKNGSGVTMQRTGFQTKQYEPPMMAPQRPTTIKDIENRSFGENVFSVQTPAQRALVLRAKDMAELQDMNVRRIEWMCAQLMLYGEFNVTGYADDGKTALVDTVTFADWTQKLTLSGTDCWSATTGTPYSVMQDMSKTIARNSGKIPDIGICSFKTADAIIENSEMLKYLSIPNRDNLTLMQFQPRITAPGVMFYGFISSLNLQIWAYDGVYDDGTGTLQQYIPDGYFIMGVRGRGSQLFGAVTQLEQDNVYRTYEGKNVPKVWSEVGKDTQLIRVASKCVPKPEFIDDWYTVKAF
ncbi:major capsid protein [Pectinatus haikarae]|uniref:major capsid protein n=1 Tax=Pectinatus haikarae TaxID=349096 RepID=UPI0018C5F4F2|nr:major capsid protein [Pectinatus haikarae]